jgi:prophage maintenance system killer protein
VTVNGLDYETVVEINRRHGGEGAGVIDAGGIRSVIDAPYASFGDEGDLYPTIWEKAAVLARGFATTQYFRDGNKRTAYLAASSFLELNARPLAKLPTIHSEAFVHSIEAKRLDLQQVAEWFRVSHDLRKRGPARDPRIEYMMLALRASWAGDSLNLARGGLVTAVAQGGEMPIPAALDFHVVGRIHWREEDMGTKHLLEIRVEPRDPAVTPQLEAGTDVFSRQLQAPVRGGHQHLPGGIMPTVFTPLISPVFNRVGDYYVIVRIDGKYVGHMPLKITDSTHV